MSRELAGDGSLNGKDRSTSLVLRGRNLSSRAAGGFGDLGHVWLVIGCRFGNRAGESFQLLIGGEEFEAKVAEGIGAPCSGASLF